MLATRFSYVSDNVKCVLFNTYFSSIIYCCILWVIRPKKIADKIRVACNDCFRIIFKIKGPYSITKEIVNKPQQEGIPTKPGYKELFILILQKTSNNN